MDAPELSVILPLYEEGEALDPLLARLDAVLASLGLSHEILCIDDGSGDATPERLEALARHRGDLRVIRLSRNFGHQAALACGLDHARGRAVVMLDGDGQHPPELIPELVQRWRAGARVVNTRRRDAPGTPWFKRAASRAFYALFRRLTRLPLEAGMADFRLLDRQVVDTLRALPERTLFLRGLVAWVGFPQVVVEFQAEPRLGGRPKYGARCMGTLALAGLTAFTEVPLRLATALGFLFSALAFAYLGYALLGWLLGHNVPGWTSLVGSVLFLGGVQLLCLGILGEYLGKIFLETKARPRYVVERRLGFGDGDD